MLGGKRHNIDMAALACHLEESPVVVELHDRDVILEEASSTAQEVGRRTRMLWCHL